MGDVTWITGTISDARVDEKLGPLVELTLQGTNQRGKQNMEATVTLVRIEGHDDVASSADTDGAAPWPESPALS